MKFRIKYDVVLIAFLNIDKLHTVLSLKMHKIENNKSVLQNLSTTKIDIDAYYISFSNR